MLCGFNLASQSASRGAVFRSCADMLRTPRMMPVGNYLNPNFTPRNIDWIYSPMILIVNR